MNVLNSRLGFRSFAPVLFALVGATTSSFAQQATGSVEGAVRAVDGTPLRGVQVVVEGTGRGALSAPEGVFSIPEVPGGEHTVIARSIGYEPASRQIEVRPGSTIRLEITLSERAVELSAITVLGTRRYGASTSESALKMDAPVLDIPQSVVVIGEEFLEDQDANRLDDLLRNVSGVNSFSTYQDFAVRGFRSQAALYNGTKANAYNFFISPKLANVERVEILKGPASVLYGSGEPGGIINIVTKAPRALPLRTAWGTVGSYDRVALGADLTGPLTAGGEFLYRLTGHYEDAGSFRRFQESSNWQIAPSLTWIAGPRTSVTLKGEMFEDDRTGQRDRGIGAPGGDLDALPVAWTVNEPTDRASTEAYTAEVDLEHGFTPSWRTNATLRFAHSDYINRYHEPRGFFTDQATGRLMMRRQFRNQDFTRDHFATIVDVTGNLRTGSIEHRLLFGADYYDLDFGTNPNNFANVVPPLDVFEPRYGQTDPATYTFRESSFGGRDRALGIYAQDLFTLVPQVKVLAGFRADGFRARPMRNGEFGEETSDRALTLRGGVVYQPVPTWSLYGNYSEGFVPRLGFAPERGGPFDPEESWQAEGGAKANLFEDRLSLTGALYQIIKRNVLVGDPNPESDLLLELGEVRSRGVEFDAIGSIAPEWSVTANYAFNEIEITEDTNPERVGQTFPNAPRHAAALWSRYDLPVLRLGMGGGVTYVGERDLFDDTVLPGYTIIDAALYYRWNRFDLSLNLKNLLDQRYFMGGYGQTTLWPGTPRTVNLTVRAEL